MTKFFVFMNEEDILIQEILSKQENLIPLDSMNKY